ncbi:sigma-70 family RNA polymerase sigma factor [Streptomyces sp. ET3-23]|uniref:sigma-70 family RNA polymerase sigma factor n=1 Tax=Streptomyces sp. ET3-23 TaxID=2885643 RepID=UPI001D0F6953|nr:sigma-70 family RNA polymerase sigma factor [Streptomyces sp. ET3-23]
MGVDGRKEQHGRDEADEPPDAHAPGRREQRGHVPGQGRALPPGSFGAPGSVSSPPALPPGPSSDGPSAAAAGVPQQRDGAEMPPSDLELVAQMRSGEGTAYEELYRRHADAVRRYARTCCRDEHTAEDLTHEVFARTLQAVQGGAGPETAVRAYLLTTVRRVAAAWARTVKREQLVEDFAVFASSAERRPSAADEDTLDLGADVRAMQEAEESLAVQAFRSLPERWQTVLWHTTVEEEPPSEVAPLLGLSANATAVLALRAREGLKQAYLQAHVSASLTSGGDCAQYADRLGAYARGRLRTRAERGMRRHLESCARCRMAALEVADVNARLRSLLPVAVVGWFAAGYSLKAAAGLAAGAASAAGAAGAAASASAAGGSSAGSGAGSGGGAAASSLKLGIAVGAVLTAGGVMAYALVGGSSAPVESPRAVRAATAAPVTPAPESEPPERPSPSPTWGSVAMAPAVRPSSTPSSRAERAHPPATHRATPRATPSASLPRPKPSPTLSPSVGPSSPPAGLPVVYRLDELTYEDIGDGTRPEIRLADSDWLWQRQGLRVGGREYRDGASVHADSSVAVELNRSCRTFDAVAGLDDMSMGFGAVRFSVYADGERLWNSGVVRGGDPGVPVRVPLTGRQTIRLTVEPVSAADRAAVADWALGRLTCD